MACYTIVMSDACVVVLDDDEAILELVATALGGEGYDVHTATSRAAFEAVREECDPDVFLVDVRLPDGNGRRIVSDLRGRTDAGIILVTGETDSTDRILGLELGADDYIVKPFNIRELRARVNAVYRRTAPLRRLQAGAAPAGADAPERPVQRFHGFSLDPMARRVIDRQGRDISLTALEFDVLATLCANANRVLSRDQIMDHVRGPGWAAYDRSIDGLVSRLRKKLCPDGSGEDIIRTVRGIGYMLSLAPS